MFKIKTPKTVADLFSGFAEGLKSIAEKQREEAEKFAQAEAEASVKKESALTEEGKAQKILEKLSEVL